MTIDRAQLEESASPSITLAENLTIRQSGNTDGEGGFDGFSRLYVSARVSQFRRKVTGAAVTFTIEGSADGDTGWEPVSDPFAFTTPGVQEFEIDDPAAFLRVAWDVDEGVQLCRVSLIRATPGSLDEQGGPGGGSQPGLTSFGVKYFWAGSGFDASCQDAPLTGLTNLPFTDGDVIAVVGQADPTEDGLYAAHSGAWTRIPGWTAGTTVPLGTIVVAQQPLTGPDTMFGPSGVDGMNPSLWLLQNPVLIGTDSMLGQLLPIISYAVALTPVVASGQPGSDSFTLQNTTLRFSGSQLDVSGLPTANPGPGLVWNNSGALAIGT